MKNIRTMRVLSRDGTVATLTLEVAIAPPWKLVANGFEFRNREFERRDLFDSLIALREELEKTGCRLLCAGARIDVFPSGMSRDMGGGQRAYITELGRPAIATLDIFDGAEPTLIGTVEQQKEFHLKWIQSLKK